MTGCAESRVSIREYTRKTQQMQQTHGELQGFPILIDGTGASEHKSKRLFRMSIKIAHLPRDIANANPVHETQDRTIELSKQTGNR